MWITREYIRKSDGRGDIRYFRLGSHLFYSTSYKVFPSKNLRVSRRELGSQAISAETFELCKNSLLHTEKSTPGRTLSTFKSAKNFEI